jgi:hypothetical protein
MTAYLQDRRDFIKFVLAASSLSFAPSLGSAFGSEEERTAWYRHAKFGMSIHWGPYSLASVEASWPIMTPAVEPLKIRQSKSKLQLDLPSQAPDPNVSVIALRI